jgi:hypothetical protein
MPKRVWVYPVWIALLPMWISYRCEPDCFRVRSADADNEGYFRFAPEDPGDLEAGDYKVVARAMQYGSSEGTAVLNVTEDEDRQTGDIPLTPNSIQLFTVRSCSNLPSTGGTCDYRVSVTNRSDEQVDGAAWSIVNASTGSLLGGTVFQTGNPIRMALSPGATRTVEFRFQIPSTVPDWGFFCAETLFGKGIQQPYFNTLGYTTFCLERDDAGFSSIPKNEVQKMRRGQDRILEGTRHLKRN